MKPKHGKGMLRPFKKGDPGRRQPIATRYTETLHLARAASPEAMQTLISRLHDPDGRIAVVAANSILERAWGRVKEQKPEEVRQQVIDLSKLSNEELALLMKLVESGRLQPVPESPTEIDGEAQPAVEAG